MPSLGSREEGTFAKGPGSPRPELLRQEGPRGRWARGPRRRASGGRGSRTHASTCWRPRRRAAPAGRCRNCAWAHRSRSGPRRTLRWKAARPALNGSSSRQDPAWRAWRGALGAASRPPAGLRYLRGPRRRAQSPSREPVPPPRGRLGAARNATSETAVSDWPGRRGGGPWPLLLSPHHQGRGSGRRGSGVLGPDHR